jgi:hypothetical protein
VSVLLFALVMPLGGLVLGAHAAGAATVRHVTVAGEARACRGFARWDRATRTGGAR